jgi:hypothetical protein
MFTLALGGPAASVFPVKLRLAFDDNVIEEPLALLIVVPDGIPCP